ncbi:MAG: bifunctional [glutamate--ammonia ligase]-adenylyl-L-tyrosine phosphorylase/[glutamate--ammonia-ligase] adenylyltransferase [Candidatus Sumerlaeia bacterium]|nr:bifunctional [glutamate--ammonia ligase]-adenylyl-L-tyrosine phosphorylase/[glutamate--ammonia-ligase] adenylyltransferase [Candidatus Sumerlaeia bacterium]
MSPPSQPARDRVRQQAHEEARVSLESAGWPLAGRDEALRVLCGWFDDELVFAEALALVPRLVPELARTADPDMALRNADRFARATFNRAAWFHLVATNEELRGFVCALFAQSQFFSDIVIRNPEYLEWCLTESGLEREKPLEDYRRELHDFVRPFRSAESRRRALCRYKRRELLRLGVRDLRGHGTTAEHCRELSHLAEAACELAFEDCVPPLVERYGMPTRPLDVPLIDESMPGFAVYAMGKFGGLELNFSSDIDLVFVYDSEGRTSGRADSTGHVSNVITNHEFYCKLANAICRTLSEPTNEGILYRVDTRLRPDGASGAIARSLPAYTAYFSSQARSWEKISYVKARCVAGNRALGPLFEERVHGFVYGSNDPDELLPEVARLKHRIDHESLDGRTRRLDIKRGPGGIREIEFFVAALQLLHGVHDRRLRVRATLEALGILVEKGVVPREEAGQLADCYWFFRRVEHVLQMMEEQQTHALPEAMEERRALARRVGFATHEDFEQHLAECRSFVRGRFEELFHEEAERSQELPLADRVMGDEAPSAETLEELRPFGLGSVEGFQALRELAVGTRELAVSSAGQRHFEHLMPGLLDELRRTAMPVLAVRHLANLMRAHHSVTMLYELIQAHPPLMRLLVRALGFGMFPARVLVARPAWLDEILEGEAMAQFRSPEAVFEERLRGRLFGPHREDSMPQLRTYKECEALYLAIRELMGIASPLEAAAQTSELAETCLRAVAELAAPEWATTDNWCVLALGGFGARQVHLTSDLDVAFYFDPAAGADAEADAGRLDRIASFILSQMSAVAPECQLWKMDARLRPDGRNAPLMVSLERARRYYREEAGAWELQSATRARFVAGNPAVGARVLAVLHEAVVDRGATPSTGREIRDMRARMEATFRLPRHALLDLKRSPGGLIDIEFLVQHLQLTHARAHPDLLDPDLDTVLERAGSNGLLAPDDAAFLRRHHGHLRTVQRTIRLLYETARDLLPEQDEKRAEIARGLTDKAPHPEALLAALPGDMARTRALFDRVLNSEP